MNELEEYITEERVRTVLRVSAEMRISPGDSEQRVRDLNRKRVYNHLYGSIQQQVAVLSCAANALPISPQADAVVKGLDDLLKTLHRVGDGAP